MTQAMNKTMLTHDQTSRQPNKTAYKLGSPEKRRRDRDELEEQAGLFGRDWRAGDRVMTWLNRHEGRTGELSRLVADGWSWADIGRAMHLAGITYRTGEPISAAILRKKASEARATSRAKRASSLGALPTTDTPGVPTASQDVPPLPAAVSLAPAETDVPGENDEPEFKPASLIRYGASKPSVPRPVSNKPPAPDPAIDVDAILARFTGKT